MSSGPRDGSRHLVTALASGGLKIGRYEVRQLLQQASLRPVWEREFVHTTDSKHILPVAHNVLARRCNSSCPESLDHSTPPTARSGMTGPIPSQKAAKANRSPPVRRTPRQKKYRSDAPPLASGTVVTTSPPAVP